MTVELVTGHETMRPTRRRDRPEPAALLGNFSVADHARVRAVARERQVLPGHCLFDQGSVATAAFLVTGGWAEVLVRGEAVGQIGAGAIIGDADVLGRRPYRARVEARDAADRVADRRRRPRPAAGRGADVRPRPRPRPRPPSARRRTARLAGNGLASLPHDGRSARTRRHAGRRDRRACPSRRRRAHPRRASSPRSAPASRPTVRRSSTPRARTSRPASSTATRTTTRRCGGIRSSTRCPSTA